MNSVGRPKSEFDTILFTTESRTHDSSRKKRNLVNIMWPPRHLWRYGKC